VKKEKNVEKIGACGELWGVCPAPPFHSKE